jgi:membrane protease YdiL (CAAX protease family)
VLAWLVTRKSIPLPFAVMQPARETAILIVYLVPLTAYLAWGRNLLSRFTIPQPRLSLLILAIKLLIFVAIPAAILRLGWKYRWRELFVLKGARRHWRAALWMSLAMIAFQCLFGRGLVDIRQSGLAPRTLAIGAPLIYLFLLLEVGLVEEFFFRVLLQSRLAAWLKSETAGIVGMALLFGLAHAPGFYFRSGASQEALGVHASWLMAIGYSIVITSVAGFFLGVLWMRTRNLLLVMVVHAAGDLVPNLVPMLKNWL